jgi:hypothetical protein
LESRHGRGPAKEPVEDKNHQAEYHEEGGANQACDQDEGGNDETNDGHAFKTRHNPGSCKDAAVGKPGGVSKGPWGGAGPLGPPRNS